MKEIQGDNFHLWNVLLAETSSGDDPSKKKRPDKNRTKWSQSDEPVPSLPLLSFGSDAMAPDPP